MTQQYRTSFNLNQLNFVGNLVTKNKEVDLHETVLNGTYQKVKLNCNNIFVELKTIENDFYHE